METGFPILAIPGLDPGIAEPTESAAIPGSNPRMTMKGGASGQTNLRPPSYPEPAEQEPNEQTFASAVPANLDDAPIRFRPIGPTSTGVIPAARRVDWYARGVGGAAAREINKIPAARPLIEESEFRTAGVRDINRVGSGRLSPAPPRGGPSRWRRPPWPASAGGASLSGVCCPRGCEAESRLSRRARRA
jgi:hypothetical protein